MLPQPYKCLLAMLLQSARSTIDRIPMSNRKPKQFMLFRL